MERIVVVGGGIGGLATALALGRVGHHVTVLERDDMPVVDGPEEAFVQERHGAPQVRHTHGLLARLTAVLRERFPEVLDLLFEVGATTLKPSNDWGEARAGDDKLYILIARRTTVEWALRRTLAEVPTVEVRGGATVSGLLAGGRDPVTGIPRVAGVRLADGTTLDADTVVVAGGRRADVPAWLADLDVTIPEELHETGIVYLTRWYRAATAVVALDPRIAGDLGYLKFMAVPGDGGTLSVTLAVRSRDSELRSRLMEPRHFDRATSLLPGPSRFFADGGAEPIGPVHPMGGLVNRLRRYTGADRQPLVTGFHAVGDAHTCTNPLYGRGCSLALVQAVALADAYGEHPDDPVARAAAYEATSVREVEPWFHASVQMDQLRPESEGGDGDSGGSVASGGIAATMRTVMAASERDPVIARAMFRVFNLLMTPEQLFADAEFLTRVAAILGDPDGPPVPPQAEGPTRDELLAETTDKTPADPEPLRRPA